MKLIVYGTLRQGERLSFILPKSRGHKKLVEIEGFEMYDLGSVPAVKIGKGNIVAELWEFDFGHIAEKILLFVLDVLESTYLHRYGRYQVKTKFGIAWMYLFEKEIKKPKRIFDWKNKGLNI